MSFSRSNDLATLLSLLAQGNNEYYPQNRKESAAQGHRTQHHPTFQPKFDVLETKDQYILEGELPGFSDKKALNIEFTDDHTLHLRGHIEHTPATTESKPASHKPTVEDVPDENDNDTVVVNKNKEARNDNRPKYWVQERSVGDFQRTFNFPHDIDLDAIKATLEHGILRIVVPKMERKVRGRKITIE